jgi:hypothetical protein
MLLPVVRGTIERRVLVNYRVDPPVLQRLLPPPFRVECVAGHGIAGICLIRLAGERPPWSPRWLGLRSENAAHRIAVTWPGRDGPQRGVYIVRRDTSSLVNHLAGGRVFPGRHHRASFAVDERGDTLAIAMRSADGSTHVAVRGTIAGQLPAGSVFADLAAASRFFEGGAMGCSSGRRAGSFDRLELRTLTWHLRALLVEHASSSWLGDPRLFPDGAVQFDSALCMHDVPHEWRAHGRLVAAPGAAT